MTVLIVSNTLQVCSSSASCQASECQEAECRGICILHPIADCCTSDKSCPDSECHVGKCDSDGKCYNVPVNGVQCLSLIHI